MKTRSFRLGALLPPPSTSPSLPSHPPPPAPAFLVSHPAVSEPVWIGSVLEAFPAYLLGRPLGVDEEAFLPAGRSTGRRAAAARTAGAAPWRPLSRPRGRGEEEDLPVGGHPRGVVRPGRALHVHWHEVRQPLAQVSAQ